MRAIGLGLLMTASVAQADVLVTFQDGAPKDRFTITNTADCATGPVAVTLDLAVAPVGLIFDVTGDGAGVEVFQPLELTSGADIVESVSNVTDGDQTLTLVLSDLSPQSTLSFTADLDDTGGGREITVSGSEIAGAVVQVSTDMALAKGAFDGTGQARVIVASCAA